MDFAIAGRRAYFTANVLFMDESCFLGIEITNIYNEHLWSNKNPHVIRSHLQQQEFSINLSARILSKCPADPNILSAQFGGSDYLNFHLTHLNGLLEDVSFNTRISIWFQHDDAPTYHSREVLSGCPKLILDVGLVEDVKLQFSGLHALLT
jgi:hypothetical protein